MSNETNSKLTANENAIHVTDYAITAVTMNVNKEHDGITAISIIKGSERVAMFKLNQEDCNKLAQLLSNKH